MVVPSAGEIVLVPFPFSDLSASKVRPAVCLGDAGRGDWILCQITSSPYSDPHAVPLNSADFAVGGLLVPSFARPSKLFTANSSLIVRSVGKLDDSAFQRILNSVVNLLRLGGRCIVSRVITFYGNQLDPLGCPIPYHRYLIVEGPAPWAGPNHLVASVFAITNAPIPNPAHFAVNNGAPGQAIAAAIAALQALPGNQGLNMI